METYIVKINGVKYEVEIEKKGAPAPAAAPAAVLQEAQAQQPAPAAAPGVPAADVEGTEVECGVAGKVWKITDRKSVV